MAVPKIHQQIYGKRVEAVRHKRHLLYLVPLLGRVSAEFRKAETISGTYHGIFVLEAEIT